MRVLSFLSNDLLSDLLSVVLRVARKRKCGYLGMTAHDAAWPCRDLPAAAWAVIDEYKARNTHRRS